MIIIIIIIIILIITQYGNQLLGIIFANAQAYITLYFCIVLCLNSIFVYFVVLDCFYAGSDD